MSSYVGDRAHRDARKRAEAILLIGERLENGRVSAGIFLWHGSGFSPMRLGGVNPAFMTYSHRQLDEIARHLIKEGYFFYRLSFVWGPTPSFRNVRGTHFYFIAGEEVLTPRQMHAFLVHAWKPTAHEEVMFFKNRLAAHFAVLPKDVPDWDGASLSEMLDGSAASVVRHAQQLAEGLGTRARQDAYAYGGGR